MSSVPRAFARSNEVYRRNEMPVGASTEHAPLPPEHHRWSLQQARDWYAALPWLVGCNFTPSRTTGSIFETILPVAKEQGVAAFCWGLVLGRTQTDLPRKPAKKDKNARDMWFHDVLHPDGGRIAHMKRNFFARSQARPRSEISIASRVLDDE